MTPKEISLESEIKARAASLGFSVCGIAASGAMRTHTEYQRWLERGLHAGMNYMASSYHDESRRAPEALYPQLKSIIVVGLAYPLHSMEALANPGIGLISGYAVGQDYHTRIPRKLAPLLEFFRAVDHSLPAPRVFSDSAPILERKLAVRAGLGWVGKNSCLVSPTHGSNLLLAEIFTALPLNPDPPFTRDQCGTCTRCVDACPTACILPGRVIDANHCLSYHSIENKGEIPAAIMDIFGAWLFGCDICQMVCPWNRHRSHATIKAEQLNIEEMLDILDLEQSDFAARFGSSAIARTKWSGLIRNVIIRLANAQSTDSMERIRALQASCNDPVLQSTIVWTLKKLADK